MYPLRKVAIGGVFAAAALTGGAVGATLIGTANAATTTSSTAAPTTAAPTNPAPNSAAPSTAPAYPAFPAHGSAQHEDQEKPVTGAAAAKAQAAAVKSVGSGTAGAVTTDLPGTGYEVTVTKADGSKADVHLDSSFDVIRGGPHGPGGPGARPNDHDADDQPAASGTAG